MRSLNFLSPHFLFLQQQQTRTLTHTHTRALGATEKHKNFKCTNRSDSRLLKFRTSAQANGRAQFSSCHSPDKFGGIRCPICCCRWYRADLFATLVVYVDGGRRQVAALGMSLPLELKEHPSTGRWWQPKFQRWACAFNASSMPDYRSRGSSSPTPPPCGNAVLWATFCDLFLIEILECVQNCMESVCLVGAAPHQPQPSYAIGVH